MNVLLYIIIAAVCFALSSRIYARYISRSLGEDAQNPTPAQICNDGRDYVPTKRYVVFAHHFSAIAGAGPIIGPTMAILYGFIPAWLWVVFGGIMIGAVHDFTVLFVSLREGGKSVAEIARKTLGRTGFNGGDCRPLPVRLPDRDDFPWPVLDDRAASDRDRALRRDELLGLAAHA